MKVFPDREDAWRKSQIAGSKRAREASNRLFRIEGEVLTTQQICERCPEVSADLVERRLKRYRMRTWRQLQAAAHPGKKVA